VAGSRVIECDVAIHGGGVAGLWTLARLRRAGYRCVLIERGALGAGQTIASQGIIHGGIKYALTGTASRASRAIAEMPGIWRACLRGEGEVDLRGVEVLSDRQWLWTAGGVAARIAGVAASKAIRTEVVRVDAAERPAWLAGAPRGLGGVDVYSVEEPVLNPRGIVRELARAGEGCIVREGAGVEVAARRRILAAGAGNEELVRRFAGEAGATGARMQRRGLHMVMVRGRGLPMAYGHCLGASTTPRLTVTSQRDREGRTVLYLGGALAEEGVRRSREEQVAAAREELRACLPWLEWDGVEAATLRIDRAEGLTADGSRPDEPVVTAIGEVVVVWPTKLAFAPLAAERVLGVLEGQGVRPSGGGEPVRIAPGEAPGVAHLPWEEEGAAWS